MMGARTMVVWGDTWKVDGVESRDNLVGRELDEWLDRVHKKEGGVKTAMQISAREAGRMHGNHWLS